MFTASIADVADGHLTSEGHTFILEAGRTIAPVFKAAGWTWASGPITPGAMAQHIVLMVLDCARDLRTDPGRNTATWESGRVMVQAYRVEGDTRGPQARFEISIHAVVTRHGTYV